MQPIDIFPWNDNFNTGLPEIDRQHRELVKLLNELASNVAFSADASQLNAIFNELTDYTIYHFQTEEAIWHQYLPADKIEVEHKETHKIFVQTILRLKNEQATKSTDKIVEVTLAYLARWLASHILESDRRLAYLVLALKSGLSLEAAKQRAVEQMSGATRALTDIILSIYVSLSTNTLNLMRELSVRKIAEERYCGVFQNSLDAINITSAIDGRYIDVNQAFLDTTGFQREEVIGRTGLELNIWFDPEERLKLVEALQKQDRINNHEIKLLKKNGEVLWCLLSATNIRLNDQPCYLAIIRNNTERKLSEQSLAESEAKYRLLFETASDGIFLQDESRVIIDCNENGAKLCGLSRAQIIGKTSTGILSERQLDGRPFGEATANNFAAALNGHVQRFEYRFVRIDGVAFDAELTMSRVDFRGALCVQTVARDITEHKIAEELLRKQKQFSDDVINNLPGIFYIINQQGNLVRVNPQLLEVSGYSSDEITGSPVLNLFDEKGKEIITKAMLEVFGKGNSWAETELVTKSGRRIPYHFSGHCTNIDDQAYLIGLGSDISERKRTQAMLRESDEKIRGIFEGTLDGVVLLQAASMRLNTCNPAFSNMMGYSLEELCELGVPDFHPPKDLHHIMIQFERLARGEIQVATDIPIKRKDDSIFYADVKSSLVNLSGIDYLVANFRDISERKAAEEAIKELAYFDPLTKLSNRRLLQDRLFQALTSCDRSGQTGALLFIDLDDFKMVNDTLGHAMGDFMLQEVAERLKSCVRLGDTVARLGGDEFVVMLEDLSEQTLDAAAQAEAIGEKILDKLHLSYRLGNTELYNTPSIGIVLFNGHDQRPDDLFRQADIAMYQAKKEGRNTMRFFDPKMQQAINARSALESELRKAIENHQFRLYYQIQTDQSSQPYGAEALIRWVHPELGLVSPAKFIPIAEDTGLILPIGHWVLETACSQLSAWQQDAATSDLILSVNVSAKQFRQVDFAAQVQAIVQRHAIDPTRLKLELTESILLDKMDEIIKTMNAINAIGVRFSLDDFGTGYSSLQYLKQLPLHQLKIDQSFVRDLSIDSNDRAIVHTIIAMAQSLNLDVIAEGVETEEQRQLLEMAGCAHYQGYLFGKPMPIEQFDMQMKLHPIRIPMGVGANKP